MPVQVTYPGVYVQEVSSGVRTITGVSTSVALFVGMTTRGRLNVPTRVLSFADYTRTFGTDTTISEMTDQVRQFFINGGQQAWILRIADATAAAAGVALDEVDGATAVLTATAKDAGVDGNLIRLEVDYDTPSPEATFNLRAFRRVTNLFGVQEIETDETFPDLSMDPDSGRYAVTIVNQQSTLIDLIDTGAVNPGAGFSRSGLLVDVANDAAVFTALDNLLSATANSISIRVDGGPPVTVALLGASFAEWQTAINTALTPTGTSITVELVTGPTGSRYLQFRSDTAQGGSVVIEPSPINDATAVLQLGTAQGGLEISGFAVRRPAPSGLFADFGTGSAALDAFAAATRTTFGDWNLTDASGLPAHDGTPAFTTAAAGDPFYTGTAFAAAPPSIVGSLLNVRQNLQALADSINANANGMWSAVLQGLRLVLRPTFGGVNSDITARLTSDGAYDIGDPGELFEDPTDNVASYSLGVGGAGDFQNSAPPGANGGVPALADYEAAFDLVDQEVDLFNLLILPRADGQSDGDREDVWGSASAFCLRRRAFLLMDPRGTWTEAADAESEVGLLRVGVVTDHTALYWPRLRVATTDATKVIDPSGSIAGLMARTDSNRGVWKAPAGLEADLRGIRGLEHMMSDAENGVINPEAVNALRVFPNGIVCWGARTLAGRNNSGNDDYKYVPVRRLALFIEESLYRGLKFAVFEPNDEPLWAQIRLAAGAFMNNLFRQGAFQGQKKNDAYFVKCDAETTTQNDINLGIVNVVVGFAPLKPAEFVIITIQQMAGQIQV